MDLISRGALIYDLCEDGTFVFTEAQAEAADKIIEYVTKRIKAQPSVPAVPIKAISVWLAAYAAPPKYALDEIAGTDPGRIVTVDTLVKAWEYHWKYLMECGLLQEEQNGTDNP